MHASPTRLFATAAVILVPVFLGADEVRMRDGRVIDGEVTSPAGASEVIVVTRAGGMSATLRLKAADVLAITFGKSKQQQAVEAFQTKRAKAEADPATTADQLWRIAESAKALGENIAFRELAQMVLDKDGDHIAARQALGYVLHDGRWMKPAEAALARGEVFFRGRWTPTAQRDAVLAEERRAAEESEAKAARAREARLAQIEVEKKEAELRAAQQAAEPAPPTIIYGSYTPVPSIYTAGAYWNNGRWGGCHRPGVITGPVTGGPVTGRPGTSGPVVPGCPPPLQFSANGQGNGYNWSLNYR